MNILKAQNLEKKSTHNDNLNKEMEFYANFYMGNFAESRYIVQHIFEAANKAEHSFNISKYAYFNACCDLAEGKYSELNNKLNETKEIEKDREGWNIAVRLLAILGHLECGHFDLADAKIESLRKHIERLLKEKEVRHRYITIVKILRDLVNNSFDFEKIWLTRTAYFETLYAEKEEEYRWNVLSPELIRFEVWFEAKAKGLNYREVQAAIFEKKKIDSQISNVG
jgi:hypothetical protein